MRNCFGSEVLASKAGRALRQAVGPVKHGVTLRCVAAAVFVAALWAITIASASQDSQGEVLRQAAVNGRAANRAALRRGMITWTRSTRERGFVGRDIDISGQYQQWWDGQKVATCYTHDLTSSDAQGHWYKTPGGQRTAYDGKEFLVAPNVENPSDVAITHKPEHRLYENFFVTFWIDGKSPVQQLLSGDPEALQGISCEFSLAAVDGAELLRVTGTRSDSDSQARTVYYLDPRRGYNVVAYEWYGDDGRMCSKGRSELLAVAGGAVWLPVVWEQQVIDPKTGNITLLHAYRVNLDESKFNEDADFSDEIFSSVKIGPHTEVSDYRGGARLNYDMDVTPLAKEALDGLIANFPANAETAQTKGDEPPINTSTQVRKVLTQSPMPIVYEEKQSWVWLALGAGLVTVFAAVTLARIITGYRAGKRHMIAEEESDA